MTDKEAMPVWSQVAVDAAEFHTALKVITQFPVKKPDAYDVVQFVLNPDTQQVSMCAASIQTMARIDVDTFVHHVETRDARFEIATSAAKKLLGVKPDMSEEVGARMSITVKEKEVIVKDESGTASELTEAIAYRIAPSLPADVPKVLSKVQQEVVDGVDAAHRVLLTPAQAGTMSAAGRLLGVEYLDPIGLDKHQHLSRVYVNIDGFFECYSYVSNTAAAEQPELPGIDDAGIARDEQGHVYDEIIKVPLQRGDDLSARHIDEMSPALRVVQAKGTGGLA